MALRKKVVITGGAGLIGSILISRLKDKYELSSLDLVEVEEIKSFKGSISNPDDLMNAFQGQDIVIHLAADRNSEATWESVLERNFVGTYNVFDAAKDTSVNRVIVASSNHATGGFYTVEPWKHIVDGNFDLLTPDGYSLIDETSDIRPDGYYGVSKAYGEALGSYYKDYHKLGSLHLRIGWVISDDDPSFSPFASSVWLSHFDTASIFESCICAPELLDYGVFYATSDNKWKIFDISRARKVLGFEPKDGSDGNYLLRPPPLRDR